MKQVDVDFAELRTMSEVHKYLNNNLFHMSEYGSNLDALHDVLTTMVEVPFVIRVADVERAVSSEDLSKLINIFLAYSSRVQKQGKDVTFYFE